jgi:carbonic anhydrase
MPSNSLDPLLQRNRQWSEHMRSEDPQFFSRLVGQQAPEYLWIGCADSRVPANEIVDLLPGELFVHRNVANVVVHSDLNCLSVLQYAVDVLKVKHVIVVGHYGCGGVQAALENQKLGLINNWLRHVQDVVHKYSAELAREIEGAARNDRLCELNVIEQVVKRGPDHHRGSCVGARPAAHRARLGLSPRQRPGARPAHEREQS